MCFAKKNEYVPFPPPDSIKFTFIDLFAGIGGFRLAMQNLGGKCTFSSEWDKYAQITYFANFGDIPFGDITLKDTKSNIPDDFDILCAGFPCQPFSIAGKRGGFQDARGTLFFDIYDIAKKHQPKVLFLENVKNLIAHNRGATFDTIKTALEEIGYCVYHKVLNTMDYVNIPQNRERLIIIAFNKNKVKNINLFNFPEKTDLTKGISDFIAKEKQQDNLYYTCKHPYFEKLSETIDDKNTVYQWRRVYVRKNKSNVCPTLTANMGMGGHNVPIIADKFGIRKLSPKECLAFQGFPIDKYIIPNISNCHIYKQVGNTVTTTLIELVAKNIITLI